MSPLYFSSDKEAVMPCEQFMETGNARHRLQIGVPAESDPHEHRVALTPETVKILVERGHYVVAETQAGAGAGYTDLHYSEAGAYIAERQEVYRADILFKINPPTVDEIALMKNRQTLFSFLPPSYCLTEEYIRKLSGKHITALAFDNIRDSSDQRPIMRIINEIAGAVSIQVAAEYLSKPSGGKGILLGGIPGIHPAEAVIIGSGAAAEFAIRSAVGMGVSIQVFDNSIHRLRRLQERLGVRLHTAIIYPEALRKALTSADILIGAMHISEFYHPVTEEMVACMKPGAVIIDLNIHRSSCCETSETGTLTRPATIKHGVIHYCVPNITSRVPLTASIAISNVLAGIILSMGQQGSPASWLKTDIGLRSGAYMYSGILTSATIGRLFGIPYQDIHLLMSAF